MENTTDNLAKKSIWARGDWKDISTALKMIPVAKESINKKAKQLADRGPKLRNTANARCKLEGYSNKTQMLAE